MQVSFEQVIEGFYKDHVAAEGSNIYAEYNLRDANKKFAGKWQYRPILADEFLNIALPRHSHFNEVSEIYLVPKGGLTLDKTLTRFGSLKSYNKTNPLCWATIQHLKSSTKPIFLSRGAFDNQYFKNLDITDEDQLYHLDGLHRLIGRGLRGDYDQAGLESSPIYAYIAG